MNVSRELGHGFGHAHHDPDSARELPLTPRSPSPTLSPRSSPKRQKSEEEVATSAREELASKLCSSDDLESRAAALGLNEVTQRVWRETALPPTVPAAHCSRRALRPRLTRALPSCGSRRHRLPHSRRRRAPRRITRPSSSRSAPRRAWRRACALCSSDPAPPDPLGCCPRRLAAAARRAATRTVTRRAASRRHPSSCPSRAPSITPRSPL